MNVSRDNPKTPADAVERFWDGYINYLTNQGVKPNTCRWYVRRIEQYIEANSGRKLAQHQPGDITDFFHKLGREGQLKDWQFRLDSAQSLPPDHRTIARDVPPGRKPLQHKNENAGIPGLRERYAELRQ